MELLLTSNRAIYSYKIYQARGRVNLTIQGAKYLNHKGTKIAKGKTAELESILFCQARIRQNKRWP